MFIFSVALKVEVELFNMEELKKRVVNVYEAKESSNLCTVGWLTAKKLFKESLESGKRRNW